MSEVFDTAWFAEDDGLDEENPYIITRTISTLDGLLGLSLSVVEKQESKNIGDSCRRKKK